MLRRFSRRSLRDELAVHQHLISRYSKFIDELHPMYQVLSWEQVAYVLNAQGDTQEFVTIRARVLRPDLQLIRFIFGCGWHQPAKFRSRIRIAVRNLTVGNIVGTSMTVTHSWLCDGKCDIIIHVPTPPKVGSEIRLLVIMDWPRKSAPLMANVADDFAFKFVQQDVKYVSYRVVLPRGFDAYHEPIGFDGDEDAFRIERSVAEDGRRQFFFEASNLPIMHRAGVKLELKGKDTLALRKLPMNVASSTP
ncbi:hypothetical protein DMH04_35540 [Kibdelosporangium aridum]|uniref:Uncharacterized protein n=1 Tax=Kibdelosporangium aridum TaxID=2030 RepID=A0A428YZH5_KIBAR|nr:hypothetical protein [Kibdelosporangium aridum]RSM76966.1 hypothetical protein DMH04_35540 [Kibdelosporangium aridum]